MGTLGEGGLGKELYKYIWVPPFAAMSASKYPNIMDDICVLEAVC